MRVHPTTLAKIKSQIKIEEVIQDFIPLKRKGGGHTLWGCCPFHQEKTPSFAVQVEKGFYKCFGCGKAGDAIHFLQEKEGMGYIESMRYLAEKYTIPWEEVVSDEAQKVYTEQEKWYILLQIAVAYYQENLGKSPEANRYLQDRGIQQQQIKDFSLGYSWNQWQGIYDFAKEKGYDDSLLTTVGLVIKKDGKIYDRFRGRLIFPLQDTTGRVVGLAGRLLTSHPDQAKYINSPETAIYHKSRLLYGLFQAKKSMRKNNHAYLVEGYTDVLAFHQAGIPNVVASGGTSLTQEQVQLFRRYAQNITIVFDGDEAGTKATLRNIDLLLAGGLDVKVVALPTGEDPDSLVKQEGQEEMQLYLAEHSQDFLPFITQRCLPSNRDNPVATKEAIRQIIATLSKIGDPVKREVYIQLANELTGLSKLTLEEAINSLTDRKEEYTARRVSSAKKIDPDKARAQIVIDERNMLHLLFNFGTIQLDDGRSLGAYFLDETADIPFENPQHQQLLEAYRVVYSEQKAILPPAELLLNLPQEIVPIAADMMVNKVGIQSNWGVGINLSPGWEDQHKIFTPSIESVVCRELHKHILRRKFKVTNSLLQDARIHFAQLVQQEDTQEEGEEALATYDAIKAIQVEIGNQLGFTELPSSQN